MRDTYRDLEHFAMLEAQTTHRYILYGSKLADGAIREDRVDGVIERQHDAAIRRFFVRYSAGISLEILVPECAWLLAGAESIKMNVRNTIDLAGFAILLGFDRVAVRVALDDYRLNDGLRQGVAEWVLGKDVRSQDPSMFWDLTHGFSPATWKLFDAADSQSLNVEQIPAYLDDGWRTDRFDPGYAWHEIHDYSGYWCVEAAIAAIRAGLDTAAIDHPFWPTDLVANYYSPIEGAPVADRSFDDLLLGGRAE